MKFRGALVPSCTCPGWECQLLCGMDGGTLPPWLITILSVVACRSVKSLMLRVHEPKQDRSVFIPLPMVFGMVLEGGLVICRDLPGLICLTCCSVFVDERPYGDRSSHSVGLSRRGWRRSLGEGPGMSRINLCFFFVSSFRVSFHSHDMEAVKRSVNVDTGLIKGPPKKVRRFWKSPKSKKVGSPPRNKVIWGRF